MNTNESLAPSASVDQLDSSAAWYLCDELRDDGTVRQRPRYWTGIHFYDDDGMCMSSAGLSNFRRLVPVDSSEASRSAGQGDEGEAKS